MAVDPPDVFIAESTFLAHYLDLVPEGVLRVIDTHNVDSVTFSRYTVALRPGPWRAYAAVLRHGRPPTTRPAGTNCRWGGAVARPTRRFVAHRDAHRVPRHILTGLALDVPIQCQYWTWRASRRPRTYLIGLPAVGRTTARGLHSAGRRTTSDRAWHHASALAAPEQHP